MTQYDLNLRDAWRIIRRRKWLVITVLVLSGLASSALAFVLAPRPLYHAAVAVRFERSINVAGLLLKDLLNISPEGDLETQTALITGFPTMSQAAKKLGLIPREATQEAIRASAHYQDIVRDLAAQVEVKRVAGTSLIEISVTSPDPVKAAEIANRTAEAFQEQNIAGRTQQIVEARRFIEAQLNEVGQRLRESEERMRAFQESDQLLAVSDEVRASSSRLATQEADYERIKKEISATAVQLRLVEEGRSDDRLSGIYLDGDSTLAKLYASLSELTVERDNLLLTLLPTHPQVKGVEARAANVRRSLVQALSSKLQVLKAGADEAQGVVARVKAKRAALPAAALEATRIERDVKVNERIFSLLKERLQEVLIKEKEQGGEISIVRPAVIPSAPVNPVQPLARAQAGLVIGLLLGLILAFVAETLDTSIGAIEEVEALLETHVLGVIPHLDPKLDLAQEPGVEVTSRDADDRHPFLTSLFAPKSRVAEAFRSLRTSLVFATRDRDLKIILVTAGSQTEGKTTVAINLAITLAQLGKRTLLVEADLRKPFIRHAFGLAKGPGLTEVVLGSTSLDEATLGFSDLMLGKAGMERLLDSPGMDNFFVLLSGYPPSNPSELLSSQGLVKVLAEARQHYDYVVLDSSPILPVPDPAILGSRVDGTILVLRVGHMPRVALRRAKALLDATNTQLLGVCLSGVRADLSSDYADIATYGYRYGPRIVRAGTRSRKRGPVANRRRSVVGGAALILALLVLAGGGWLRRSGRLTPDLSRKVIEAVPVRALAAESGAQEALAPSQAGFTVLISAPPSGGLSAPGGAIGSSGSVSIGQFGTPTEAKAYGQELVRVGMIDGFTVARLSP